MTNADSFLAANRALWDERVAHLRGRFGLYRLPPEHPQLPLSFSLDAIRR